jgi:hypothetical protein
MVDFLIERERDLFAKLNGIPLLGWLTRFQDFSLDGVCPS